MISFMCNIQNRQIHVDGKQIRGFQGLGRDGLMDTGFLFGVVKMFWN